MSRITLVMASQSRFDKRKMLKNWFTSTRTVRVVQPDNLASLTGDMIILDHVSIPEKAVKQLGLGRPCLVWGPNSGNLSLTVNQRVFFINHVSVFEHYYINDHPIMNKIGIKIKDEVSRWQISENVLLRRSDMRGQPLRVGFMNNKPWVYFERVPLNQSVAEGGHRLMGTETVAHGFTADIFFSLQKQLNFTST